GAGSRAGRARPAEHDPARLYGCRTAGRRGRAWHPEYARGRRAPPPDRRAAGTRLHRPRGEPRPARRVHAGLTAWRRAGRGSWSVRGEEHHRVPGPTEPRAALRDPVGAAGDDRAGRGGRGAADDRAAGPSSGPPHTGRSAARGVTVAVPSPARRGLWARSGRGRTLRWSVRPQG